VSASGRAPDVLIVSEFPRTGATGLRGSAIGSVVESVLRQRSFRAGPYTVGYQACDEGTPSGNYSGEKCMANANAIARTPRVVGVVGTYWSTCTYYELSALNPTATGRVAMVSPVNTSPGLTRPGVNIGQPRNFARVVVDDETQNAAGAVVARALGKRRLYILATREDRADWIRKGMTLTAFEQGVEIVGAASWGRTPQEHRAALDELVEVRPGAVFVDGTLTKATGDMIRAIRRHTPRGTVLISRYVFIPVPRLLEIAGDAAVGLYMTTPTPPYDGLTERGKAVLRRLFAEGSDAAVDPWAPLAAQATEVLLNAIARSDGTRDSVTDEVFRTNIDDGVLQPFRINSVGDIQPARFAVMRVTGEMPPSPGLQPDFDGAVLDRIVTVGP
jgi:branched-chain amino acid transport system substrate-binding protein